MAEEPEQNTEHFQNQHSKKRGTETTNSSNETAHFTISAQHSTDHRRVPDSHGENQALLHETMTIQERKAAGEQNKCHCPTQRAPRTLGKVPPPSCSPKTRMIISSPHLPDNVICFLLTSACSIPSNAPLSPGTPLSLPSHTHLPQDPRMQVAVSGRTTGRARGSPVSHPLARTPCYLEPRLCLLPLLPVTGAGDMSSLCPSLAAPAACSASTRKHFQEASPAFQEPSPSASAVHSTFKSISFFKSTPWIAVCTVSTTAEEQAVPL